MEYGTFKSYKTGYQVFVGKSLLFATEINGIN